MQMSWLVLVPPVLVVVLALVTRRIVFSLCTGILSATLILHDFQLKPALITIIHRIWSATELGHFASWESFWSAWYLFICLFLVVLGIIIVLINQTGGAFAYGRFIVGKLRSARNAEAATLLMSHLFFVDDYFGSLTVGSVMQPITDQFKIPRAKLALIINAVAAPLAVLSPISSWSADIVMQLRQSGISNLIQAGTLVNADPFSVYLLSIPFLAYAVITIISLWFAVKTRISSGIILEQEQIAQSTGNLFGGKIEVARRMKTSNEKNASSSSIWDFALPLLTLFGSTSLGIALLGFSRIPIALFLASCSSLLVAIIFLLIRKKLNLSELPKIIYAGAMLMLPSIMVLILIWTLSALLKGDLQTGNYLAQHLIGHVNIAFLPVVFFLIATLISSTMGSAWGTIGLLVPIAVPMIVSFVPGAVMVAPIQLPIIFPLIASIVSGAVAGNHVSPIADIMLLSSTSAGSYHFDLVKAQITYAIPIIIGTIVHFLIAGLMITRHGILWSAFTGLGAGLVVSLTILYGLSLIAKKR